MSSSRATGPLLGRLAAAAAGAAMRGKCNGGGALRAIVESSSTPSMLFAGHQCRPYATSSWIKLFKPAQAFFGGGSSSSSGSGSAASTSAVTAAATVPTAAAAAPPQFGFAASAAASAAARAPPASPPKKAVGAAAAGTPPTKKKKARVPRGPTAYALFLKEQLAAAPAGDARSFAQRSAAVAAAWKVLPPASRARFEAASRAAKAALPPREASKPARALSGYQLFVREKLPTLRDEEGVPGGAGAVSAMRAAAAAWSSAPAQVKAEFAARAKAMGTKR